MAGADRARLPAGPGRPRTRRRGRGSPRGTNPHKPRPPARRQVSEARVTGAQIVWVVSGTFSTTGWPPPYESVVPDRADELEIAWRPRRSVTWALPGLLLCAAPVLIALRGR